MSTANTQGKKKSVARYTGQRTFYQYFSAAFPEF